MQEFKGKGPNEGGIINQILFRFLPYWPLFLLFFLLSGAGGWLYIRYKTPLYQSTARILIKDEKKGAEDTKALEDLNMLSSKKIIENEEEVIQSNTLLNDVVNTLHLYAPIYEEGQVKNASAYMVSPVELVVGEPNKIKITNKVFFTTDKDLTAVKLGSQEFPINEWVSTSFGKLKFILNKHYNGEGTNKKLFFTLEHPKDVITNIQTRLKVTTASKLSSILDLSIIDEVPRRGEDILNELLASYNQATITDKNALAANTLAFVEDRLKGIENDLNSIEHKNQQYKSRKGAIDIGEQGKLFLQNVSSNDQKLSDINMQLAVLDQVENYVHSKNNAGGIVPSTLGVADPLLSQLVDKLYSSELEYESLKNTTAENNPTMLAITDKIEKIKPSILENIHSQRRSLEAGRKNLATTNNNYSSALQNMPEQERKLIDINREQNIKNQIYSFLLQKREETALSHAATVSDSRIVDKASTQTNPVSPQRKLIYLSSLMIALIGSIGIVTAREKLNSKIMFRHEIEGLTEQPIIGEICIEDSKTPIVIGANKKTFIAEQFRKLRMTLKHIGINSKRKRILVTSSISGEGKSFIATNLALTLALTGKKVVLVDCDLNNPSLNNKLNLKEDKGVAEFLQGICEVETIIRQTDLDKNLYVISTGKLPSNPSELIMDGHMEDLLNQLDGLFDYVVIDTAPVSPVTDAYILSPFCDATLYVIRHGYTPKVFVERIDENNKLNHLNNLAIVFNGVQSRGFGSKNYGYGYGYGYIYNDKGNNYKRLGN